MRSFSTWSAASLRQLAWGTWAFAALAALVVPVPLALASPPSASGSSWGTTGVLSDVFFQLLVFSFPTVGLVILHRQPRNRVGWLLLAGIGLPVAVSSLLDDYATYGLVINPGALPSPAVAAGLAEGSWVWMIGMVGIFLILLFPDGRLPSRRWRWLPWLGGFVIAAITVTIDLGTAILTEGPVPGMHNPLYVESMERQLFVILLAVLPFFLVSIVAAAVALVLRFRRSHGVERLQLKWLAEAGAIVAGSYLAAMGGELLRPQPFSDGPSPAWLVVLQNLALVSFGLIPVAIGIAILRHRLYDIDRVINRTLVYGLLTTLLVGTYVATILVLRPLLDRLTGESDLAVAASTLAVAAVFRPLRSRVQHAVDRRFYRRKYDAARTVDAFAERLRQEVDLDAVSVDLQAAADATMQPTHVSLWLRPMP